MIASCDLSVVTGGGWAISVDGEMADFNEPGQMAVLFNGPTESGNGWKVMLTADGLSNNKHWVLHVYARCLKAI